MSHPEEPKSEISQYIGVLAMGIGFLSDEKRQQRLEELRPKMSPADFQMLEEALAAGDEPLPADFTEIRDANTQQLLADLAQLPLSPPRFDED